MNKDFGHTVDKYSASVLMVLGVSALYPFHHFFDWEELAVCALLVGIAFFVAISVYDEVFLTISWIGGVVTAVGVLVARAVVNAAGIILVDVNPNAVFVCVGGLVVTILALFAIADVGSSSSEGWSGFKPDRTSAMVITVGFVGMFVSAAAFTVAPCDWTAGLVAMIAVFAITLIRCHHRKR